MKKVLISGFTTFSTHSENSSEIMASLLSRAQIPECEIHSVILPVAFSSAFEHLKNEIDTFKPDFVICLGLAGNRTHIDLEKVAINLIHCEIPDNEGVLQKDQKIIQEGPLAYFSTLPINEMLEVKTPFKKEISFSAGAYVCNYLIYRVLHFIEGTSTRAGFIHLPHLKENQEAIFQSLVELIKVCLLSKK